MRSTLLLATLALLSLIDWAWTLAHLARGVPEANPLLAYAHELGGVPLFSAGKLGITACAVWVLAWQRHHRLTQRLLPFAVAAYGLVMAVHIAVECTLAGPG